MKFHLIIQNIKNRMPLILVDSILKDFILVDKRKSELVIEGNSEWFYPLHLETVKWYRLSNAFVHCLIVSFNVIDWAWVMMFAMTVVHWQILVGFLWLRVLYRLVESFDVIHVMLTITNLFEFQIYLVNRNTPR